MRPNKGHFLQCPGLAPDRTYFSCPRRRHGPAQSSIGQSSCRRFCSHVGVSIVVRILLEYFLSSCSGTSCDEEADEADAEDGTTNRQGRFCNLYGRQLSTLALKAKPAKMPIMSGLPGLRVSMWLELEPGFGQCLIVCSLSTFVP